MPFKQSKAWKFFSSVRLAVWLLTIIALLSLTGTFIPQNSDSHLYIERYGQVGYDFLLKTGLTAVYSSWWFVLFLVILALNLLVCLVNRFSLKKRAFGPTLSHLSILIILLGALTGIIYGQKGFIQINEAQEINSFVDQRGRETKLGFSLRLNDFIFNENISPNEKLFVYLKGKENFCRLDHSSPVKKSSPQNIGGQAEPIAEVLAEPGAETKISDTGYSLKVLRYLPDFMIDLTTKEVSTKSVMPNNPAVEIEFSSAKVTKTFWVFARFPDMHQEGVGDFKIFYNFPKRRPKDFISQVSVLKDGKEVLNTEIRVNHPLRFGGWTFFQISYDQEALRWSGLQVAKDPGVGIVYAGFVLLIIGLIIIFYVNPLAQKIQ